MLGGGRAEKEREGEEAVRAATQFSDISKASSEEANTHCSGFLLNLICFRIIVSLMFGFLRISPLHHLPGDTDDKREYSEPVEQQRTDTRGCCA